jgi:hypothetical protein
MFAADIYEPVTNELLGWINPSCNFSPDIETSHYQVKINWGDGSEWSDGWVENIPGNNVRLEVRGAQHVYCIPGVYQTFAYITGPDNTSHVYQMGSANVSARGGHPPARCTTSTSPGCNAGPSPASLSGRNARHR